MVDAQLPKTLSDFIINRIQEIDMIEIHQHYIAERKK